MVFDLRHQLLVEQRKIGGHAEAAVIFVASGASGYLGEFRRAEVAVAAPVKFAPLGECHMVDIHVEPHADGIGGDEKINLARLIHRDLRVARARAQAAHHHGRPAALLADHFGDGIDIVGGKRGNGRTARQTRELLGTVPTQFGKPRAAFNRRIEQVFQNRRHGRCPEQKGLVAATRVQNAVGENMSPLGVGGELHFVNRHKIHLAADRHGLGGADEKPRIGRHNFFFAGNQCDICAMGFAEMSRQHAVVNLAREQAQGQSDHAALIRQHALHGEMGFARVGWAQNNA